MNAQLGAQALAAFSSGLVARLARCVDEVDVRCARYDGELQWPTADGPAKSASVVLEMDAPHKGLCVEAAF